MSDTCESCGCPEGVDGHDVLYREIDELKKAVKNGNALSNLATAIGTVDADERKTLCDEIERLNALFFGEKAALKQTIETSREERERLELQVRELEQRTKDEATAYKSLAKSYEAMRLQNQVLTVEVTNLETANKVAERLNRELQERYDIYADHLKTCVVYIAPEIPCDCGFLSTERPKQEMCRAPLPFGQSGVYDYCTRMKPCPDHKEQQTEKPKCEHEWMDGGEDETTGAVDICKKCGISFHQTHTEKRVASSPICGASSDTGIQCTRPKGHPTDQHGNDNCAWDR